jgi:hypothetical protein
MRQQDGKDTESKWVAGRRSTNGQGEFSEARWIEQALEMGYDTGRLLKADVEVVVRLED